MLGGNIRVWSTHDRQEDTIMRWYVAVAVTAVGLATATAAIAKPPLWDTVKKSGRFKVLKAFKGEAVVDAETGLVWTTSPGLQASCNPPVQWASAIYCCTTTIAGGRLGWRLPSLHELSTLFDASSGLAVLPADAPFTGASGDYWTSTSITNDTANALAIRFPTHLQFQAAKTSTKKLWCVRSPGGYDLGN
jgi:hypothetical protein